MAGTTINIRVFAVQIINAKTNRNETIKSVDVGRHPFLRRKFCWLWQ